MITKKIDQYITVCKEKAVRWKMKRRNTVIALGDIKSKFAMVVVMLDFLCSSGGLSCKKGLSVI